MHGMTNHACVRRRRQRASTRGPWPPGRIEVPVGQGGGPNESDGTSRPNARFGRTAPHALLDDLTMISKRCRVGR